MTAGLPGTGISGFFYLFLVVVMPLVELYLTLRGKSSVERWKMVGYQWTLTIGIALVCIVEYTLLILGLRWLQQTHTFMGRFLQWCTGGREFVLQFNPFGLTISLLVLAGVIGFTYMINRAQEWSLIGKVVPVPVKASNHGSNGAAT